MKKITKIDQVERSSVDKKTRVAAYCRVSTGSDEQIESLDTQKRHYEKYIKSTAEWEYVGLYFDAGVSGTKKELREGLLSLIEDCERGLIDLVLTKSISRFCRNTADCLELVRKLLGMNIFVCFEKENINTGSMESELMLSLLSGLAEEESVSMSQNEKWSVKKKFQNGTYIVSYPPFGYTNVGGKMVIVSEQAAVVKKIFIDTLAGKSTHVIAEELSAKGIQTKRNSKWTPGTVNAIIKNEKYTGDAIFQKTYTDENFYRHKNYGEEDQYLVKEHHEPIITHDIYDKANEVIKQRGREKGNCSDTGKYQNRYSFSSKIKCSECGSSFKRRIHYKPSGSYVAWACDSHVKDKKLCSMKYILDDDIKSAFLTMMNKLRYANEVILKPLQIAVSTNNRATNEDRLAELDNMMAENLEQRKTTVGLLSKGYLDRTVFIKANNDLITEYARFQSEKDFLLKMNASGYQADIDLKELISFLNRSEAFIKFEDGVFEKYVDCIEVIARDELRFVLKCGLKLTERL